MCAGKMTLPESPPAPRANVLGVGRDAINLQIALDRIARALAEKNPAATSCVTGVHGVMEAQEDAEFRNILNHAWLNTPDGMPMVWVGRQQGFREMDRVYGPDLMLLVCEYTRDKGYRHFFYGGADGVAEELKQRLVEKFPGLNVVGTYTPPFRPPRRRGGGRPDPPLGRIKTGHYLGGTQHAEAGEIHGTLRVEAGYGAFFRGRRGL